MKQLIRKILKEETERKLNGTIRKLLQSIIDDNKDIICDIEIKSPKEREVVSGEKIYTESRYMVKVKFIGGYGSNRWPRDQYVAKQEEEILNEISNKIHNFLGIDFVLYSTTVKKCDESSNNKGLTPIDVNRFVYHKSNPIFRKEIEKLGLHPKGKSDSWLSNTPIKGEVIFATNSDNKKDWFDSTYDDDIYRIDTSKLKNKWFKDPNFPEKDSKHVITFEKIPNNAIQLIYKGSGKVL